MATHDTAVESNTPSPALPGRTIARWTAIVGGAGLVLYGLARRSVAGGALILIGSGLVYRGTLVNAESPASKRVRVHKTLTINRPAAPLYSFWRNFENLPRFMKHLEIAQPSGSRRSHWVATAPLGRTISWDAEITQERENELIAWQALPTSDVQNSGQVEFHPAVNGWGTEVTVTFEYEPPAGDLGVAVAKLFGEEPQQQVEDDLRRFKQLMETGEVPTIEGQPSARDADPNTKKEEAQA